MEEKRRGGTRGEEERVAGVKGKRRNGRLDSLRQRILYAK
jgi:hypothetical protein